VAATPASMLRSWWVTRRGLSLLVTAGVGACWTDPVVEGAFTEDQWQQLRVDFTFPDKLRLCAELPLGECPKAAALGQELFFDQHLSDKHYPLLIDALGLSPPPPRTSVSCASCHEPKRWFIDSHATNDVSQGALGLTGRNSMTLVNSAEKERDGGANVFT